ncbi:MAG: glycosyltransferase family 39 protein [Candidatus Melainabacteria bacterium]|nr:glycosyltransferase family 39 protein [Candidatus Melainabacteria bacterium]
MSSDKRCWQRQDSKLLWIIITVGALMYLPALGSTGILNTSDAYYTEAAREMLEKGDFITPYLNYKPYYFKPILTYWLIIASYLTFGINTFAARLPSALGAIGSAVALFVLVLPFVGRRAALMAGLSLLSMPLFTVVGHIALTDMPLVLLTTITTLLLLRTLVFGWTKGLIPAYICLGLAFLSKGPLAVAVVGICIGGFLVVTSESFGDFKRRIFSLKPLLGIAIPLIVALPWFVAEHIASDGAFTKFFFIDQNFGRLSGKSKSHLSPIWFYAPYLLGGFIPWLPLLASAPAVFRPKTEKRFSKSPRAQICIAAWCWLFGTLALLLVTSSKLGHYLLPIAPPIAILTGVLLDKVIRLGRRRFIFWLAPVMVIGCTVGLFVLPRLLAASPDLLTIVSIGVIAYILGYFAYGALVYNSKIRTATILLFVLCLSASGIMVPIALEHLFRKGNESLEYLIERTKLLDKDPSIGVLANESPILAFYAKKNVFEFAGPSDCPQFLATTKAPNFLILNDKYLQVFKLFFKDSLHVVEAKGKWNLVSLDEDKPTHSP